VNRIYSILRNATPLMALLLTKGKTMQNRIGKFKAAAALAFAVVILAGCGGGSSTPADTTAPTTTVAPAVSGTSTSTTTLSVTINEDGTGYYLALAAASAVPAVATVEAATSFAMTANVAATQTISGLTPNTAYTIYFVAKDAANNVQTTVQSVAVTMLPLPAGYVFQGGLTWMPITANALLPWPNAAAYCAGWRQPTQTELSALYISGAMNGQGWLLTYTWSSTPFGVGNHYDVSLYNGGVYADNDGNSHYASCVR